MRVRCILIQDRVDMKKYSEEDIQQLIERVEALGGYL